MDKISLQDKYALTSRCFGCGPANEKGLRIKSIPKKSEVIATWHSEVHHEAFPGILCGGIIGTLLDCHSNWAAAYYLMKHLNLDVPPCTVTAFYNVTLKRPTPSQSPVHLVAQLKEIKEDRALMSATLFSNDIICATCEGLFVAVKEDHPAFCRWGTHGSVS